jgi:opacity protein-like surface antigen
MKNRYTSCVIFALLAFALAWPAAAQNALDQRIDSNIDDWAGTYSISTSILSYPRKKRRPPRWLPARCASSAKKSPTTSANTRSRA